MRKRYETWKSRVTLQRLVQVLGLATLLPVATGEIRNWAEDDRNTEANQISGTVTHVRDGDTIEIQGRALRIANLDCAKLGTAEGETAKIWMRDLLEGAAVTCSLSGRKSYDRDVGTCRFGGTDLGEILINERVCPRWKE